MEGQKHFWIHPLRHAIYGNHDPYHDLEVMPVDLHGWGGDNPFLAQLYKEAGGDGVAADVGTWKGQSCANVALQAKARGHVAHVIAVDTFLGSTEHWERTPELLGLRCGRPTLYETFLSNMWQTGLSDFVTPLPLPANQAAEFLKRKGGGAPQFDYVYVDANHDYPDVAADIRDWWPLVKPGGIMAGDDYSPGAFPGVVQAVNEAFGSQGLQAQGVTWFVRKPA